MPRQEYNFRSRNRKICNLVCMVLRFPMPLTKDKLLHSCFHPLSAFHYSTLVGENQGTTIRKARHKEKSHKLAGLRKGVNTLDNTTKTYKETKTFDGKKISLSVCIEADRNSFAENEQEKIYYMIKGVELAGAGKANAQRAAG